MQKDSRFFDDLARMGSSAFSSVLDVKREVEVIVTSQLEKLLIKMNLATREEYEVVREMAVKAREENEKLSARLAEIEKKLDSLAQK